MRLREHRVARALVGRVPLDQLVEGALGVEHHRPQLARPSRRVHAPLLVAQLAQPERVGEPPRRVDRQHRHLAPARRHAQRDRRRRRGLAHAARARADADLLALEPVLDHSDLLQPIGQQLDLAPARLRLEQVGQRGHGRACLGAQALELLLLSRRPVVLGERGPHAPVFSRTSRRRRTSAVVKRCGSTALATIWSTSHAEVVAEPALEVDRLVDRHLLRQRNREHAGRRAVAQERVDLRRLAGDRALPARWWRRSGAPAAAPARARWPGRP